MDIYTLPNECKIDSQWEAAAQHREISSVLCDHLEVWGREGGRQTQEGGHMGIYVYIQLIHSVIKQKLTHHCKPIILQKRCLKKNLISLNISKHLNCVSSGSLKSIITSPPSLILIWFSSLILLSLPFYFISLHFILKKLMHACEEKN